MRIKEVEERTGLTAKAIRLYESKGLLRVARQAENAYRDYTEEDVERLKTIAVLRRLDVSIKEIKDWCDDRVPLSDLLHRVTAESMLEAEKVDNRLKVTAELAKILDEEPEKSLGDAIGEAEELRQLYAELEAAQEEFHGTLMWPLWFTIIAMGPVGWTAFRIFLGQTERALWSLAISLVILPFVCWQWFRYFQVDRARRKKSGCLAAVIFAACGLLLAFGSILLVSFFQQRFLMPETGYYTFRGLWQCVTVIYPIFLVWLIRELSSPDDTPAEEGEEAEETVPPTWRERLTAWAIIIALHIVLYYCCITGVSVYDGARFLRHGILHPTGEVYEVSDVVRVEAGFYGKWTWLPWKQTGDFYYEITFSDGRTENWAELYNCADEDSDPWEDLLEFDRVLMEAGVEKISDWDNREYFDYDQSCLDICDAILNNQ